MTREAPPAMPHRGFQFEEAEDRRAIVVPGLRLTFARVGARWSHALAVGNGDGDRCDVIGVASTIEGDPDRDDPARVVSPSYQEVQRHDIEGGIRLLLTGMSVPHHFSAVVTARRDGVGDGVAIDVDVADRCRAPVAVLAATYLVALGSGALIDAGPERIVWGGDALGRGRLEFAADGPGTVALAEAGRQATRVQALAQIVPTTYTQRLGYRWRWTPPPDKRSELDDPRGNLA